MKLLNQHLVKLLISLAVCGTASAHNINSDSWVETSSGTGNTVTVNPAALPGGLSVAGITSLSFSSGTGPSNPVNSPYVVNTLATSSFPAAADQYEWHQGSSIDQDVELSTFSLGGGYQFNDAPVLTIAFGYGSMSDGSFSCSNIVGETASVTVNGNTYQSSNPCALAAGSGDLTFVDGVLKAGTGVGWTEMSTSTAPELDPSSAASGLALLVGSLLVLSGRRSNRLSHA